MIYVLAVLAAVGVLFLLIHGFSRAYYRKKAFPGSLYCDIRGMDRGEILDLLETFSTLVRTSSGQAAIQKVILRARPGSDVDEEELVQFMRLFELKGEILFDD